MKKQVFFSAAAVLLAVGGVFASNRFADTFYPAGDSSCSRPVIAAPCTVGTAALCQNDNNIQYYYKINGTGSCLVLKKPSGTK